MVEEKTSNRTEQTLGGLESRLQQLLDACDTLKRENAQLRQDNSVLVTERGQLLSNRDKVRTQVEAMITRLKALENG